jgi:hypothetical protein
MELNSKAAKRGYQICRKPGQADDESLDSFEWQPSKDSDELFEALKKAYPRGTNHRYRMRDALIDFLIEEREAESETRPIVQPAVAQMIAQTFDNEPTSQPNNKRGASNSAANAPQNSGAGSGPTPPETPDSAPSGPRKRRTKDWDDMTVVWTSGNGLARASRPKRMMTEEERKNYQLRRTRGACVSCKTRKRKVRLQYY